MTIKRRTIWQLGLALLFVTLAAIALMERPDRDVAAEDVRSVTERSRNITAPIDLPEPMDTPMDLGHSQGTEGS